MPFLDTQAVTVAFDGDVWRADIHGHAANATDPFDAIVLAVNRAREAGFSFDFKPGDDTPDPKPIDEPATP